MELSRDQVNTIIKNAPTGTDKRTILEGLIRRGYDLEGVDSSVVKQQMGITTQTESTQPVEKTGIVKNVFNALTESEKFLGEDIGRAILGGDKFVSGIVGQYQENAKKLTDLAEKQTDPVLKQKYGKMAAGMLEDAEKVGLDLKGRTPEQIIGDVLGVGLDVATTLTGLGAVKAVSKTASLGSKIVKGTVQGAKYGAAYGLTGGLQENKDIAGVVESTLKGGVTGAVVGGALSTVGGVASKVINKSSKKISSEADKLAGQIVQGQKGEQAIARKVLTTIDTTGVKTEQDLLNKLKDRVNILSETQDKLLAKNTKNLTDKELNISLKVGKETIKHNYVADAISQIKDFYAKTNDQIGLKEIQNIENKVAQGKITVKEINDLARIHGQKLNAYNASGQLASGLTKQAAENTRAGLKSTVRQIEGTGASEILDREITQSIKVRDLISDRVKAVNDLQQKIQERGLGAKAGYQIGKLINLIGMGSPKGLVEALIPRGRGYKTLNALDLERMLSKNLDILNKLNKAIESNASPKIVNGLIDDLIKYSGQIGGQTSKITD